jgi:hypothetical protein
MRASIPGGLWALSREGAADRESIGARLLADIKAHFEAAETDRLSSARS